MQKTANFRTLQDWYKMYRSADSCFRGESKFVSYTRARIALMFRLGYWQCDNASGFPLWR